MPSDTDTMEHTGTQSGGAVATIEGAGLAAATTAAADLESGKSAVATGIDAAEAAAQAVGLPDRIAALESHIPIIGTILGVLQNMFPHSALGTVAMPAPAGDQTPATPPPQPTWNGQAWVLPAEPTSPPPAPVWDAASKSWKLPA